MKHTITLLLILTISALAHAQPPVEATCRTCHGAAGAKPIVPSYPKLNGQNKAYLASSLIAYRDGKRTGGLAAVMTVQASKLSDAEIEALAEYYSSQN